MVGVTWKAKRSMSLTAGPGGGLRAASQPPQAVAAQPQEPPRPVITFKDKQSYQELFKPLPKPEPIPTLNIVQIECKSWMQLQKERDEIIQREIEKTKMEAEGMYNRVLQDDRKRCEYLQKERDREDSIPILNFIKSKIQIENEQRVREELLSKEREERRQKDEARKAEIRRQEEILANSRNMRSKTVDLTERRDSLLGGGGIQVYHYKDKVVPEIVKQTRQEELRRKNSVGFNFGTDLLASLPSSPEPQPSMNGHQANGQAVNGMNGVNGLNGVANGVNGSALNGTANGGGQNGSYEARVFPQQTKMNRLPPRPMKDPMAPSRQFQNNVDSAFMGNGGGHDGQSNGFCDPSNIYKSVMGGKGYY